MASFRRGTLYRMYNAPPGACPLRTAAAPHHPARESETADDHHGDDEKDKKNQHRGRANDGAERLPEADRGDEDDDQNEEEERHDGASVRDESRRLKLSTATPLCEGQGLLLRPL